MGDSSEAIHVWLLDFVQVHSRGLLHRLVRSRGRWRHQVLGLGWPKARLRGIPPDWRQGIPGEVYEILVPGVVVLDLRLDISAQLKLPLLQFICQLREVELSRSANVVNRVETLLLCRWRPCRRRLDCLPLLRLEDVSKEP